MEKASKNRLIRGIALGILIALLLAILALFVWETVTKGFSTETLTRMLIVLAGLVLSVVRLFRGNAQGGRRSRSFYAAFYEDELRSVFLHDGQRRARRDLLEGIRLYNEDRCARAIDRLHRALKGAERPADYAVCHLFIALSYTDLGEYRAAEASYRTLLRYRDDHAVAWGNLGRLLVASGAYEEGIAAYRRSIDCDPDYAIAHNNLAQAFVTHGAYREAISEAETALRLDSRIRGAESALAISCYALGEREACETHTERYVRLGGDRADLEEMFSRIDSGTFPSD